MGRGSTTKDFDQSKVAVPLLTNAACLKLESGILDFNVQDRPTRIRAQSDFGNPLIVGSNILVGVMCFIHPEPSLESTNLLLPVCRFEETQQHDVTLELCAVHEHGPTLELVSSDTPTPIESASTAAFAVTTALVLGLSCARKHHSTGDCTSVTWRNLYPVRFMRILWHALWNELSRKLSNWEFTVCLHCVADLVKRSVKDGGRIEPTDDYTDRTYTVDSVPGRSDARAANRSRKRDPMDRLFRSGSRKKELPNPLKTARVDAWMISVQAQARDSCSGSSQSVLPQFLRVLNNRLRFLVLTVSRLSFSSQDSSVIMGTATDVLTPNGSIVTINDNLTPHKYHKVRYVFDDVLEGGALREGGAPKLFSKDYIGLVAQYAAVGLLMGLLPNVIYPFLQNYLNISGSQTTTAATLVNLPWSFKVFYGMVSDCYPIMGYRRRPYMVIGWIACLAALFAMAFTPVGEPYFTVSAYRDVKPDEYTPEIEATLNRSAADEGWRYIIPMMLTAFGYVFSDVCADGIVVELAQREPADVRGTTQTVIYITRTVFGMVSLIVVAFAFNGQDYGGDFDFSLSFPELMLIFAIAMCPMVPLTWFFIKEEQSPCMDIKEYLFTFWEIVQTRAVYQVIAYTFFSGIFMNFTYTSKSPIQTYWAGVTTLNDKISTFSQNAVLAIAMWLTGKYGLQWSWRTIPVVTMFIYVAIDACCSLLTIWDIERTQWFWMTLPIIEQLPLGVAFIVSTYIIIELSTEGHEGAMYGLLSTVSNLSAPFATAITRNVASAFNLSTERIQNDSYGIRRDVTITVVIMYIVNLLSLVWLVMLPRQKEETQALKQLGGSSRFMGMFTVAYLVFALIWSVMTNIMEIFPSTSCLAIAGGDGCS